MKKWSIFSCIKYLAIIPLIWIFLPSAGLGEEVFVPGIEELYRLDRMAILKPSLKVASISSYDRTGGNNDGFDGTYSFVRKEEGGLVLADLTGPGVIYRIWTPTPTDDVMEFYFDGEEQPRILVPFRDIFMGKHPAFERPLVGYGAGGFYCYRPIPYEKSCKVFIRAPKIQFYQINYATYPPDLGIKSFTSQPETAEQAHIEKAQTLFGMVGKDISAYTVPAGGQVETLTTKATLEAGKSLVLAKIDRPGRIVGMRVKPAEALMGKQRDIAIRAFWDGDEKPAILSPAGDFFGFAWGEPAAQSLLVGTSDETAYCYFPMPFDRSAQIELVAEKEMNRPVNIEAELLFVPIGRQANEGKYYSLWRRENPTTEGKPYTFIETEGRGHLAGVMQQSQGFESGNTYFFEGDDQTILDGELAIHGTGSEDFYNGGWYDVPGRWETRRPFVLSGCLGYKKHLGRTGGYRIFLGDAYAYRKSLVQTIEHAPTGNDLLNDYCSVVYLYSQNRPTCRFELPAREDRAVIDLPRIVFAVWWNVPIYSFSLRNATLTKDGVQIRDQKEVRFLSMRTDGGDMFGEPCICFTCEIPAAGRYKISLDVVKGPEQGIVQLFEDEAPVGPKVDLYHPETLPSKGEYIGTMEFNQGPNNLLFKLVGQNEQSKGMGFDLTNIVCEKVE